LGFGKVGWWCSVNQSHEINREAVSPEEHATVRERLAQLFDGWCTPVKELIQTTPLTALVRNPVFDRPPVRKWGGGSVTLVGDAIHPTTPNLGQGGCLAIEDAVVVARCLSQYASDPQTGKRVDAIQSALRRFESLRFSRTAMVARLSRLYGAVGQWENPTATELRSWVLSTIPAALVQRVLRWTFDYDAYDVTI
jgi:2-polyprenyl-6-methoxyphenol hydroxylase-like FAD-dependent oxidoreductase